MYEWWLGTWIAVKLLLIPLKVSSGDKVIAILFRENIDGEYLKDIYVILLERLDDSQDPIRKKTATAINLFFLCRYLPLTMSFSSIIEYMVNAIFVHYDDSN